MVPIFCCPLALLLWSGWQTKIQVLVAFNIWPPVSGGTFAVPVTLRGDFCAYQSSMLVLCGYVLLCVCVCVYVHVCVSVFGICVCDVYSVYTV